LTGAAGSQGLKGDKGDAGAQGSAGLTGAKGDKGDTGPMGFPGAQGSQGPIGPIGPQGPAGAAGPQGPAGSSNLTLATPVYTIHPSCPSPGVLTLDGKCTNLKPATSTAVYDSTACPDMFITGASNVLRRITITYTTPSASTCAAACAGRPAPRSDCVAQTHACVEACYNWQAGTCPLEWPVPQCVATGTVNDLACDCDNKNLGSLVK
jgi:hypothetical protein